MIDKSHEVYRHKHICLVEDHSNPLGIVRSLGEKGISPTVLLCSEKPHLVNKSKYIGELHLFPNIEEGFAYLVENYKNEELKPFVYHGSDNITLLLDSHYDELKDNFYFFNGQECLSNYLQKEFLSAEAEICGFNVPRGELKKVGELPQNLRYPLFTKAVTSSNGDDWKAQSYVCETEEDLLNAYKEINVDTILIQEYIQKKDELSLEGYCINGGEEVFIPYYGRYYRLSDKGFGYYLYFIPFDDNELLEKCRCLLKRAKYSGIFSVDFLVGEDNSLYFLEINFRNSAWATVCAYGGVNLPYSWAVSSLDEHIDCDDFKPIKRINAMAEIDDFREYVFQKREVSLGQWIKNVRNTDVFFVYNKSDLMPFWSEILYQIKHQIKKRIYRKK